MKSVFLTGISGLLGTNLAHGLLENGYNVKGLVRRKSALKGLNHPGLSLTEGDLFSDLTRELQSVDIVIHAAAETRQDLTDYSDYYKINYDGTVMLYQTAVKCHVKKFIFISTANTMGFGTKEKPGTEFFPVASPFDKSGYANSKQEAEKYLLGFNNETEVIIINPTFMIGPRDSKPSSGKIILMGWRKRIVFCPPGGKNFVHVEDVVQAVLKCMVSGKKGERFLIAGENLSFHDFFKKLFRLANQRTFLVVIPEPVLTAIGYAGDLIRFLGIKSCLSSNNMRILCVKNFYSNQKSVSQLGICYRTVDSAILDALEYFSKKDQHLKIKSNRT